MTHRCGQSPGRLVKARATVTLDDAPVEVGSLVTLRLSYNPGVAVGMGDGVPGPVLIVVTAVVTVVLAVASVRGALGPSVRSPGTSRKCGSA